LFIFFVVCDVFAKISYQGFRNRINIVFSLFVDDYKQHKVEQGVHKKLL